LVRSPLVPALVLLAVLARPAHAQDRMRDDALLSVPAHMQPSAGMCRVWLKDVPAAQQPAQTECSVAIRSRSPGAVVLFGKDATRDPRGMATPWASRSSLGRPGRGAASPAGPSPRLVAPDQAPTQVTPARVLSPAKPEKPQ
jgi:hypothetical protein